MLEEISNIRVDLRVVDMCKEIYKGVYLMLANRNIWILDLNFCVFYSLATIERIKQFYGFVSVVNSAAHSKGIQHKSHYVCTAFGASNIWPGGSADLVGQAPAADHVATEKVDGRPRSCSSEAP